MWAIKGVTMIPVLVGSLSEILKFRIYMKAGHSQKTDLLGTERIIRSSDVKYSGKTHYETLDDWSYRINHYKRN